MIVLRTYLCDFNKAFGFYYLEPGSKSPNSRVDTARMSPVVSKINFVWKSLEGKLNLYLLQNPSILAPRSARSNRKADYSKTLNLLPDSFPAYREIWRQCIHRVL